MRSITTSSGTSPPPDITAMSSDGSFPAAFAARSMSPVAIWGMLQRSQRTFAWVPFPAPGGPTNTSLICLSAHARG